MRLLTTEEVIERALATHANKYTYEKFVYVNKRTKSIITCATHGDFEQLPLEHADRGHGCMQCRHLTISAQYVMSKEDFICKARATHGEKYDYSNSVYINSRQPITMRCHLHGDFTQNAHAHVRGHGCPTCSFTATGDRSRHSQDAFMAACRQRHGERYDYSQALYTTSHNKVTVICRTHGPFMQQAGYHVAGQGCARCWYEDRLPDKLRLTQQQFLEACQQRHGERYNYGQSVYHSSREDVTIICRIHGAFVQNAGSHMSGSNCPKCSRGGFSLMAIAWLKYRAEQDGVHIQHAMNEGEHEITLPTGKKMKFDGFAPETNTVYEFLGDLWHGNPAIFHPDDINPVNKKRMGDLYRDQLRRNARIQILGYTLTTIWEAEWNALLKNKFFDDDQL